MSIPHREHITYSIHDVFICFLIDHIVVVVRLRASLYAVKIPLSGILVLKIGISLIELLIPPPIC